MENKFKPKNEKFTVTFEVEISYTGDNYDGTQKDFYADKVRSCEFRVSDYITDLIGMHLSPKSKVSKIMIK